MTLAPHCVLCSAGVRRSAAKKQETIHLVEHSTLPVGRTLDELDVPRNSFYRWYRQYQQDGLKGLEPQPSKRRHFWNRLPEAVCDQILQMVLAHPEKSAGSWLGRLLARRAISSANHAYFGF
jgi:transposase-like protein